MFLNLIGFRLIKYINIPEIALKDRYGIEIIAKNCNRNPYELFTGISRRVKRIYIDG